MRKITRHWLKHAGDDLRSAEILLRTEVYTVACFHCQQCLEKSLKAVLQEKNIKPPRIHNIKKLKDIAENALGSTLAMSVEEANFLSGIYVESRYPLDVGLLPHGEPAKEDAQKALDIAERVFAQIEKLMGGDR